MLQNEFPRFGGFFESAGAAATGGTFGLLSSQYDQAFKVVFSQAPGVAQIGGGALGNAAFHTMRTGAINGAAGAARLGAASGLGYLAAYLATYKYAYNKCMS
jgi:hypothetical protein